jgi:splicing factor 3A subunit 2
MEAKKVETGPGLSDSSVSGPSRRIIRIGRPAYRVIKQRDPESHQRSLLFEISYPDIEEGVQPRHRFMGAFEQRKEIPDKAWQYLIFAADPYETVAFKIPSDPIDRREGRFFTDWNETTKLFRLQLYFRDAPEPSGATAAASAAASSSKLV